MYHYSDEKNKKINKYVMMIIEALKFIALYTYFDKFCKV